MITPTIGRQVWFHHGGNYPHVKALGPIFAATIVHVWDDRCINIAALDSDGMLFGVQQVALIQDTGDSNINVVNPFATWMPYQKAVASGQQAPTLHETDALKLAAAARAAGPTGY